MTPKGAGAPPGACCRFALAAPGPSTAPDGRLARIPGNTVTPARPPCYKSSMGIWTDAFIAPPKSTLLRPEAFGRLTVELARERVARTPSTLLAGQLCVNASLNWGSVNGQARWDGRPSAGTVLRTEEYRGIPNPDDAPSPSTGLSKERCNWGC